MPSFQDSALLVILALILFGPKRLPELARQLGKLMAEFRRASNEFRMQMEDELRIAEQEENRKKIAAMQAAAPATPALPDHPATSSEITPAIPTTTEASSEASAAEEEPFKTYRPEPEFPEEESTQDRDVWPPLHASVSDSIGDPDSVAASAPIETAAVKPLPIATSGELNMMPPATGLPVSNSTLSPVLNSIPHDPEPAPVVAETTNEVPQHG